MLNDINPVYFRLLKFRIHICVKLHTTTTPFTYDKLNYKVSLNRYHCLNAQRTFDRHYGLLEVYTWRTLCIVFTKSIDIHVTDIWIQDDCHLVLIKRDRNYERIAGMPCHILTYNVYVFCIYYLSYVKKMP